MKNLPDTYKKFGYTFNFLFRKGDVAIFEQTDDKRNKIYAYEVFIIQKNAAGERFGKYFEASESVPPTESWGSKGFTFHNYQDAVYKAIELLEQIKNKPVCSLKLKK